MLEHQWKSGAEKVKWKRAGDVLEVEGVLIYPGVFYGLDGKPTRFTAEVLREIIEGIDENIPLKLTHFDDRYIGYATRFGIDDDGTVWFKGYVFDEEAIEKIEKDGYDGASGEFKLEMDGEEAVGGFLDAIAFVSMPAATHAGVKEAKSIALERGDVEMEEEEMARKSPDEFFKWIEDKLKAKGVDKVDDVMKVIKEAIKYPYPYPYPKAQGMEEKVKELETELENVRKELETYRSKWMELKQKELEKVVDELQKVGVSKPLEVVEDIEDVERKIAILQKMKETIVLSSKPEEEEPKMRETEHALVKAAEELGMTVEELKDLYTGGE